MATNSSDARRVGWCLAVIFLLALLLVGKFGGKVTQNKRPHSHNHDHNHEREHEHTTRPKPRGLYDEQYAATMWKFDYINEQSEQFTVSIKDPNIDHKLANVINAVKSAKIVDVDGQKFDSGSPEVDDFNRKQVANDRVDEQLCGLHLRQMLDQIQEMQDILEKRRQNDTTAILQERHLYLTQVLDSFGRYESGQLLGKIQLIGSYAQCVNGRLMLNETSSTPNGALTPTRYCWSKMKLDKYLNYAFESSKKDNLLSVAICLPESCHSLHSDKYRDLLQKLIDSQFKLPKSLYVEENLPLESIYCLPDPDGSFGISYSGMLLITLLTQWVSLVIYATMRSNANDLNGNRKSMMARMFDALSLKNAWQTLICLKDNVVDRSKRVELDTMNPIKVLSCSFVVLGHSFMILSASSIDTLRAFRLIQDDPAIFFMVSGIIITDTFYIMTGMILTYITLKKLNPKVVETTSKSSKVLDHGNNAVSGPIDYILKSVDLTITRFLRLVPLYYLVFWFRKGVLINIPAGSVGPLWDNGFNRNTEAGGCRQESWWSPVTFGPARLPLGRQCMPHAWSVVGDLFCSILMGPIVVGFLKKPRLAILAAFVISIASSFSMYGVLGSVPQPILDKIRDFSAVGIAESFRSYGYMYTTPFFRCYSMFIGVLAGFSLYRYDQWGPNGRWPSWFTGKLTKFAKFIVILTLVSPSLLAIMKREYLTHNFFHIKQKVMDHYLSIGRYLWDVSNAIIMLRMCTDWKDYSIMQNFAGKFWQSLVRLNYAILLIHVDLMLIYAYSQMTGEVFNKYKILTMFTSTYMMSIAFALPMYIFLEHPIDKLIKVLKSYIMSSLLKPIKSVDEVRARASGKGGKRSASVRRDS